MNLLKDLLKDLFCAGLALVIASYAAWVSEASTAEAMIMFLAMYWGLLNYGKG